MVGRLFSVPTAAPASARVLELGCGDGGNLVPMAVTLPGATFVGIDLAATAIARGAAVVERLGLANVDLRHGDLAALPGDLGTFDYVIAHGVYSWIPDAARAALLEACRTHLAPGGIAFVSYNAYPGSHLRDMVREMLAYHLQADAPLEDRLRSARELLEAVAGGGVQTPYGNALAAHAENLLRAGEHFVFHDDLGEHHRAFYFHEFAADAAAHDLQFVSEADFHEMELVDLPPAVAHTLRTAGSDSVRLEQYMDFVKVRMFRQTLLCHADVAVDRAIGPGAVREMAIASPAVTDGPADLAPGVAVEFLAARGASVSVRDPLLKAALVVLGERWPAAVGFEDLLAAARARAGADGGDADRIRLGSMLLQAYVAQAVELHLAPPPVAAAAGERPVASPLARLQAAHADQVTSLRHRSVALQDAPARRLITLLDGTRDRAALAAQMGDGATAGDIDDALRRLCRLGLIAA